MADPQLGNDPGQALHHAFWFGTRHYFIAGAFAAPMGLVAGIVWLAYRRQEAVKIGAGSDTGKQRRAAVNIGRAAGDWPRRPSLEEQCCEPCAQTVDCLVMNRVVFLPLVLAGLPLLAQRPNTNYDEAKVKPYTLPDLLGGAKNANEWSARRRPALLAQLAEHVYGRIPAGKVAARHEVTASGQTPDGMGNWKHVRLDFGSAASAIPPLNVLVVTPKGVTGRAPVFVTLSFTALHTLLPDKTIPLSTRWQLRNQPVTEASRGTATDRWPWPLILGNGFGVAVAYYGDLFEDRAEGLPNSIIPGVEKELGVTGRDGGSWQAMGAWAWGLGRMLDYVETNEPALDARKAAVVGHSRLGKAALWAGAWDERFAMVISNDSGEGGASLARRIYGEHVADLNRAFPHWFATNYAKYAGDPGELPVDQHQLLASVAPRALYVASAEDDKWADPRGEYLALEHASPAYELFGIPSLKGAAWPGVNEPLSKGRQGYHLRTGKHDINAYDWQQYLAFARKYWGN